MTGRPPKMVTGTRTISASHHQQPKQKRSEQHHHESPSERAQVNERARSPHILIKVTDALAMEHMAVPPVEGVFHDVRSLARLWISARWRKYWTMRSIWVGVGVTAVLPQSACPWRNSMCRSNSCWQPEQAP